MSKKERVFNVVVGLGILGIVYTLFMNLISPNDVTAAFVSAVTYSTAGMLTYAGYESLRQGLTGRL
jgi:hypothetical protein